MLLKDKVALVTVSASTQTLTRQSDSQMEELCWIC